MKVLLVTQPGEGHLNPMLPAARSLLAAGHELAVVSAPRFAPKIRDRGLVAIGAGLDYLESEVRSSFPAARRLAPHQLGAWFLGELFADLSVHAMVPDLLALVERERPDLLLRTNYEYASCIVGELAGIPHATLGCAFMVPQRFLAQHLEQPLAFARSAWGLAPFPALAMLDPHLHLTQAPLAWHEQALPTARAVRPDPVTLDGPDPLAGMPGLRPDWPLVYASMGTVNNTVPGLFAVLLAALRELPLNLVITVGRNVDIAALGPQPGHVVIRDFIPQDLLLARCDLFLTSASFFTVVSAILHGVPTLMCPLSGDTPAGALRFAELGVGLVLRQPGPPEPPMHRDVPVFAVDTVRDACRALLADPRHRARVHDARRELLALPPWSDAVPWLAALARDRRPR